MTRHFHGLVLRRASGSAACNSARSSSGTSTSPGCPARCTSGCSTCRARRCSTRSSPSPAPTAPNRRRRATSRCTCRCPRGRSTSGDGPGRFGSGVRPAGAGAGRRAEGPPGPVECQPGTIVVRLPDIGQQADRPLLPGDRRGEVAGLGLRGRRACRGSRARATASARRRGCAGHRARAVPQPRIGAGGQEHREVVVGLAAVGIQADGLGVVGGGRRVVTLAVEEGSQVDVRLAGARGRGGWPRRNGLRRPRGPRDARGSNPG